MTCAEVDDLIFRNYLVTQALAPRLRKLGLRCSPCSRTQARHRRGRAGSGALTSLARPGATRALVPIDPQVRAAQEQAHERGEILRVGIGRITGVR